LVFRDARTLVGNKDTQPRGLVLDGNACSNVIIIGLYSFASRAADIHAAAGLKCPVRRTAGLALISTS
jgi:hypothetical protein